MKETTTGILQFQQVLRPNGNASTELLQMICFLEACLLQKRLSLIFIFEDLTTMYMLFCKRRVSLRMYMMDNLQLKLSSYTRFGMGGGS